MRRKIRKNKTHIITKTSTKAKKIKKDDDFYDHADADADADAKVKGKGKGRDKDELLLLEIFLICYIQIIYNRQLIIINTKPKQDRSDLVIKYKFLEETNIELEY